MCKKDVISDGAGLSNSKKPVSLRNIERFVAKRASGPDQKAYARVCSRRSAVCATTRGTYRR